MKRDATPVIEVRSLQKVYASQGAAPVQALQDIDFSIREGAFVSIVGPSGCGKSTLLQILGGLLPASAGQVLVAGTPVTGPMPGKIALVFQDATLMPWKSAIDNVLFPLEIQKVPREERLRRGDQYLKLVGLEGAAHRLPHQLSGGMKQRVSIARGLAQEPRIILMDEPFGALDEQNRIKMGHELLRIWEATGKTIVLITHSLTEAIFLSDTVIVMGAHPGRILERVEIELPRPRTYDVIGSPEFGAIRNRLWRMIEIEPTDDDTRAVAPEL
ncbi:MAG: ABC transporter ATP-binding protein [Rhodoferax sp.]|nr:ABC transporter ATP-binding protein [Rhodoferax sp.]